MAFHVPETARITTGPLRSTSAYGNNGAFRLPGGMFAIASDGGGWEHVSVSFKKRTPTWDEMCYIKDLFWDDEDCVIQFHPPKSKYVNFCKYALHLWRQVAQDIEPPPGWMIGPTKE